jgi:hypothetical protein
MAGNFRINTMMDLTQAKRDARDMKKAKINALKEAVLSTPTENPITSPTTTTNESVGLSKTCEGTNICNRWLELYTEQDGPVSLPEIQQAKLCAMFPIIYCINNKDITDDSPNQNGRGSPIRFGDPQTKTGIPEYSYQNGDPQSEMGIHVK